MSQLTLIRGLPGSGKSTLAMDLVDFDNDVDIVLPKSQHIEADMFFEEVNQHGTVYHFDPSLLQKAHEWCQAETFNYLEAGHNVYVSNTFTTLKELRPYFDIAKDLSIEVQVLTCHANFGNVHSVPEEVIAKMKARFQYDISSLYS
jgi:predicted kinase